MRAATLVGKYREGLHIVFAGEARCEGKKKGRDDGSRSSIWGSVLVARPAEGTPTLCDPRARSDNRNWLHSARHVGGIEIGVDVDVEAASIQRKNLIGDHGFVRSCASYSGSRQVLKKPAMEFTDMNGSVTRSSPDVHRLILFFGRGSYASSSPRLPSRYSLASVSRRIFSGTLSQYKASRFPSTSSPVNGSPVRPSPASSKALVCIMEFWCR